MATMFEVIFDNGGGTTLMVGKMFAHHYDDPTQCATDVQVLLDGGNTNRWDGNEPEARLSYDYNTERNGGYRWYTRKDIEAAVKVGRIDNNFGYNEAAFFSALGVKVEW